MSRRACADRVSWCGYTFLENHEELTGLRVVVRAGMSHDMADLCLKALRKQTALVEALSAPLRQRSREEVSPFKQ